MAAVVAMFILVATHWRDLPSRIPIHFGLSGRPNRWGGKGGIWLLPCISAGIYILLTIASKYQMLVNVPFSVDRERPEVRHLISQFVRVLKAVILITLFFIFWESMYTAIGKANGLGGKLLPVVILAPVIVIIFYLLKLKHQRDSFDRNP